MNRFAFLLVMLFSTTAFGMNLYCNPSGGACAPRVSTALSALGCQPDIGTLSCRPSTEAAPLEFCQVEVAACMDPSPDMIITTHCNQGSKRDLKSVDAGISLTWWMGFGPYVTEVCKF